MNRDDVNYRLKYVAENGPGPYRCCACDGPVELARLRVHHLNGNHEDNAITNLAAVHHGCHSRIHMSKLVITDATRQKQSVSQKRAWEQRRLNGTSAMSEAEKKRRSALLKGTPPWAAIRARQLNPGYKSEESRQAQVDRARAQFSGKPLSAEQRAKISRSVKASWDKRRGQRVIECDYDD